MRLPLANLLVRSPLLQIDELMSRVVECAEQVPALLEAQIEGDHEKALSHIRQVSVLEGKADEIKNHLRAKMPIRLFLPVDRRDFLALLSQIDAIADAAEDVGVLFSLRRLDPPQAMHEPLREFLRSVMDCVHASQQVTTTLPRLLASGFGGGASKATKGLIDELHRKEHIADKRQTQTAKILFAQEDNISAVQVFLWNKVLNKIGDMANHAENVGDLFRLFLAR